MVIKTVAYITTIAAIITITANIAITTIKDSYDSNLTIISDTANNIFCSPYDYYQLQLLMPFY